MTHNVPQIHAGRDLTDELPTKYCFSNYYFPVNEAETPDLRVFCCCWAYSLFIKTCFQLVTDAGSKSSFSSYLSKRQDLSSTDAVSKSDFSGACQTALLSQTPKQVSVTKPNNCLKPDTFQGPTNMTNN